MSIEYAYVCQEKIAKKLGISHIFGVHREPRVGEILGTERSRLVSLCQ